MNFHLSKRLTAALILSLLTATSACAQTQVGQTGTVTARHPAGWTANRFIGDLEPAGGFSQATVTNTGTPLCVNDALITSAAGYHQLCLGANAQGGGLLSYNAYGGAGQLPLSVNLNGQNYQLPFSINGIVGPSTTVVDAVACWNNTSGTLLGENQDCTIIGANPNPTAAGFQLSVQATPISLTGFAGESWDNIQSFMTCGPTSENVLECNAIAGYVRGKVASPGGNSLNSVGGYFSVTAEVAGANSFGVNVLCTDSVPYAVNARSVTCHGIEADINASSSNAIVSGYTAAGASLIQPIYAVAFQVDQFDVQNAPSHQFFWNYGYNTLDGCCLGALHVGALKASGASGGVTNIASQPIQMNYWNSADAENYMQLQAYYLGMLLTTTETIGGGHNINLALNTNTPFDARSSGYSSIIVNGTTGSNIVLQGGDVVYGQLDANDASGPVFFLSAQNGATLALQTGGTEALIIDTSQHASFASTVQGTRFISTVTTGTAPLTVASTTNVANLNASSLGGATFAAPGAIGGGTPSTVTGTTINATTSFQINGVPGVTQTCTVNTASPLTLVFTNGILTGGSCNS